MSAANKIGWTSAGGRCKDVGRRKYSKIVGSQKSRKSFGRKKWKGHGEKVVVRMSVGGILEDRRKQNYWKARGRCYDVVKLKTFKDIGR